MLANFRRAAQDNNDYLDPAELPMVGLGTDFAAIDSNGDGMIVRDEVARAQLSKDERRDTFDLEMESIAP